MEFNQKLQELRRQRGLTQEELAGALYVSRTAISKWESGRGYPNIESLKAIAKFFSISLDELLSGDEVLAIAEHDNNRRESRLRDLFCGLLDISMFLLLFLPFFASRNGGVIESASLISLVGISPYLKAAYFISVALLCITGILMLALQNLRTAVWQKGKVILSLSLGALSVLIFTLSLQPYAAAFTFTLLVIKVFLFINRK